MNPSHTHIIWTKCYIDTIQPLHISDAFLTYVMYKCSKNRYGARAFFRFKEDNSSKSLENSMCCKQFFDVYSQTLISDFCSLYASKFSCIGKTIFSFFRLTCACLQQQFFYTRIFMYKCIETFPLLAKKTFESEWESIKPVKLTFNRYTPCSIW